ncbi:Hypothetical protein D9617_43g040020 [Elsinoe fawcettii]|nr:Hypothetical protein D9617_43g040020 [Elsinoe fawcettii]
MSVKDASVDYEGVYYLSQLTDTNRSGWLLVCGVMTLSYSLCFLAMRTWIKHTSFGPDDWMCAGSSLLATVQHAVLFAAVGAGLGRAESVLVGGTYDLGTVSRMYQALQILFILAYGGAKLTIATLVYRLFAKQMIMAKRACEVLMGLCIVWIVSALLTLFINCDASITTTGGPACSGEAARWTAVAIADLLLEAASLTLVCVLINQIQLKRSRKISVILSFLPRLGLVIPAALHAVSVRSTSNAADVAFAHVDQAVWLQAMLAWSLLTCSIPSFKAALRPFERKGATYSTSTDRKAYDEAAGNLFPEHPTSRPR